MIVKWTSLDKNTAMEGEVVSQHILTHYSNGRALYDYVALLVLVRGEGRLVMVEAHRVLVVRP